MIARFIGGLVLALLCSTASAEVADVAANGFQIRETAHIAASTDVVYAALIAPAHWWNPDHTYSHDAANLTLDPKAGGCFCEKLANGGSVQHLTVVYADPGKLLRLRGALGPFQGEGVDGALTITLKGDGKATDLTLTYNLGGYMEGGYAAWSKAADGMLSDLVARLKNYSETGRP